MVARPVTVVKVGTKKLFLALNVMLVNTATTVNAKNVQKIRTLILEVKKNVHRANLTKSAKGVLYPRNFRKRLPPSWLPK